MVPDEEIDDMIRQNKRQIEDSRKMLEYLRKTREAAHRAIGKHLRDLELERAHLEKIKSL